MMGLLQEPSPWARSTVTVGRACRRVYTEWHGTGSALHPTQTAVTRMMGGEEAAATNGSDRDAHSHAHAPVASEGRLCAQAEQQRVEKEKTGSSLSPLPTDTPSPDHPRPGDARHCICVASHFQPFLFVYVEDEFRGSCQDDQIRMGGDASDSHGSCNSHRDGLPLPGGPRAAQMGSRRCTRHILRTHGKSGGPSLGNALPRGCSRLSEPDTGGGQRVFMEC